MITLLVINKPAGKDSISSMSGNYRCIQGTSRESLYMELGLESLQSRWWYRKVIFFIKY